LSLKK
jgi:hypothetical protein